GPTWPGPASVIGQLAIVDAFRVGCDACRVRGAVGKEWKRAGLYPVNVLRISGQVPAIVERASHADVVKAVIKQHWFRALCGKDTVHAPAFQHLREARFTRKLIRGGEGEAVPNVEV